MKTPARGSRPSWRNEIPGSAESSGARPPLIIAHRGASAYEVENSIAAFRAAIDCGADGIELDVHATADGVLVVHHDPVVEGQAIRRKAYDALRTVRLSNGEPLPTLPEALAAIGQAVKVFVEVKALDPALDEALLRELDRGPAPAEYQVHSFDHRIVKRLKARRSSLSVGVLSASYPVEPTTQLVQTGAQVLWQHESLVDGDLVDAVHGVNGRLFAWTVDDASRIKELVRMKADALCTNRPDVARKVLS